MEFLKDIELDDEIKGKLTEGIQAYVQTQIEEQVTGLKAKNDELLAEKKRIQRDKEKADAEARIEAERVAQEQNDFKQLYESQKAEAEKLQVQLEEVNSNIQRQTVMSEAARLASGLTKDVAKAKLLEQQISQRLTLVDGEIKVLDESGQLTVSKPESLTESIRENYPFLVDGSQASGGGAARSQGGADAGEKMVSRTDFDAMGQRERATFVKEGGKVIDD